jgi:phosphoribosylanthranilate isomerase
VNRVLTSIRSGSVKICSLREPAHAEAVMAAGADLFGLIFVPGVRRYVEPETAAAIVARARAIGGECPPRAVGVFVDADAATINAVAARVGLDLVQLSGSEPPELLGELTAPAIKAIRPSPDMGIEQVESLLIEYADAAVPPVAFLIDGYHPHAHGGVGARADWKLAADLSRRWPVVLAGGLTPENVGEAIDTVGPLAVDVSSGVETDGVKNPELISAFVTNARAAFAANGYSTSNGTSSHDAP